MKDNQKYMLGAHFSIAKGLHMALYEAKKYDCDTLQIFTKNANTWKERVIKEEEINLFKKAKLETEITQVASHTSYLINLASPEKKKLKMSVDALLKEMLRSSILGISYVVLHPGSHMKRGERQGCDRITESINRIFADNPQITTRLLLETTAGQGSSMGHTFEQLASIIDRIDCQNKIGVCLDTAHIFAAGYDIRNRKAYIDTITTFDRVIGLKHLFMLHLNDSKKDLGTHVDRHENIGQGLIGIQAFSQIMNDKRFVNIPKIIETPKGEGRQDLDLKNLNRLRGLVHSSRFSSR